MQTRDEDEIFSSNISDFMYEKEKCNFCVDMELSVLLSTDNYNFNNTLTI